MLKTNYAVNDDECCQVEYLETPMKSENDTKEYRVIRLQNGLTALLISDTHSKTCASQNEDQNKATASSNPETKCNNTDQDDFDKQYNKENQDEDTSEYDEDYSFSPPKKVKRDTKMVLIDGYTNQRVQCGLCVGVGSFSDPPEIPGMAHFLEYMVLLGSEKYPQRNDFHKFFNKCGGYINAWTDCEHTTFHYDVPEKHLLPTLDRFAQIFIKPLLKKDIIGHERETVKSEFQLFLPEDDNRKDHLLSSFARAGHPASKFIWGNLITLRDNVDDDKLYEELHKFKERHYSAHRMKLAIQASLSLDTLEKYVTTCFADVPNNNLPPDDFNEFKDGISFNTPAFRKIYKIQSIKDINQLQITWPMPSIFDFDKSKPHHFIMRLIGCAQEGSLNSYLHKKMWSMIDIFNYSDHDFEQNSMYTLLKLTLQLTDEGQEHFEEVLNAIFSFINFLKMKDMQKKIYDERFNPDYNNFIVIENSTKYVKDLCKSMHHYSSRDYIIGKEIYKYDPEALQTCLNYLRPENANIMILSRKFNVELDKIEPLFNIRYTDIEIPQEWIERWKIIEPLPDFHLPLPNKFFISNFFLLPMPANIPKFPEKIHSDTISEIWFRPSVEQPICFMYFHFISSVILQSSKNAALTRLYCTALQHLLTEEIYLARMAGFHIEFIVTERGIQIKLQGYKEKMMLLLFTIVKHMVDYPNLVTKKLFEVSKRQELGTLYNTFMVPSELLWDVKMHIIKFVHYTYVDMYTALRNVNFNEFQNFIKSFNDCFYIQCLAQGNLTPHIVLGNVRECIKLINCKPLLSDMQLQKRVMQLPLGTHYCKLKNMNRIDVNSIVSKYYQVGVASTQLSVLLDLLLTIMMEPLFNQLIIKEQLGNEIKCYSVNYWGIVGYYIMAYTQANKYTTEHVNQRIEKFLELFNKILEELSEKDLDDIKETLKNAKQCNLDLHKEVTRNWNEITRGRYMFDRLEREVLAINDIKLNELKEWFAKHMLNGSNIRKLSIHVVGRNPKEDTADEAINIVEDCNMTQYSLEYITKQTKEMQDYHITDVEDYKKDLYIYPEVKEFIFPSAK